MGNRISISKEADLWKELTCERYGFSSDRQQVVHIEEENSVAQDEGHLEKRAAAVIGRQQEAEEVHSDEEGAGDQQIHHIEGGPAPQRDLHLFPETTAGKPHFSDDVSQIKCMWRSHNW